MVQDLATQWLQSYPCKTKESREVPGADEETQMSFTLTVPQIWANLVKNYLGIIHCPDLIAHQANSHEHTRAEAAVNHNQGNLGSCVKEAAAATHSLTCGVPNRESNEVRYLKQAAELIEEWQNQRQGVPPVSRPSSEHGDVVFIEPAKSKKGDTFASC